MCECPGGSAIVDKECLECFAPVERCQGGKSAESDCGQGSQVSTKKASRSSLCELRVHVDPQVVNDVQALEIRHVRIP